MSVSMKAYLYFDSNEPEIRRFSVDQSVSANYSYLVQKIKTVFPNLLRKEIILLWKDADDELVTFSSDEELVEALGSVPENLFKVYVKVDSGAPRQTAEKSEDEKVQFPGVVCDGCEANISGVRFKCISCPDYDLCATCEATGMHPDHDMLRMRKPGHRFPWNMAEMLRGFGFPHGGPHGRFHPGRGHCRRGRGHRRGGPYFGGCPWMGQQGGATQAGPQAAAEGNQQQSQQQEQQQGTNTEVPVGPPLLHAMGEAVASFLNPFGIEVHTYTDDDNVCCKGQCNTNCCPNKSKPSTSSAQNTPPAEQQQQDTHQEGAEPMSSEAPAETESDAKMDMDSTAPASPDHEDFILVDKKTEEVPQAAKPQDPIEECIEQLQNMGFDTGAEWMKTLVEAKKGNISMVLDAIHPMQ